MLASFLVVLSFDPLSQPSAEAIPEQVPTPIVVRAPASSARLRGDFEVPDHVLLVYSEFWPSSTETIATHILASGGRVALVREALASPAAHEGMLRGLTRIGGSHVEAPPTVVETTWARDWGPLQLVDQGVGRWLDADYVDDERWRDDEAPIGLAAHYRAPLRDLPWPLDGGALIANGAGLCALTFEYLDSEGLSLEDDDLPQLLAALGCEATAVVPTLVDELTKHADMVAQFVGPERLMLAAIEDEESGDGAEDALRLAAFELGLRRAAASLGLRLTVVHVPTPALTDASTPYSYVNGLRLADRYLMPSYPELGEDVELRAWDAVQTALGDVPVVPVDTSNAIRSGGAIHCLTVGLFD